MRHLTQLILCLLWVSIETFAVPALRHRQEITLEDGTKVMATFSGDEFFSYFLTDDGQMALKQPSGLYRIMTRQEAEEATSDARIQKMNAQNIGAAHVKRSNSSFIGERRGLVILAQFEDVKFSPNSTREYFDRQFNEPGFTEGGNSGSVHDYFFDQSYGQFNFTFDVVGPVTLNHPLAFYGGHKGNSNDIRPREFAADACRAAADMADFSQYDWDGDGYVDLVFVVFAGYSEAQHGGEDCIWPHFWAVYNQEVIIDGVRIWNYACSSELRGRKGEDIDGTGTACHEFSHSLGLPDLYDTTGGYAKNMGSIDVMAAGSYLGDPLSTSPMGYSAFERASCGWLQPTELNSYTIVDNMQPLENGGDVYCLKNDGNSIEYILLENRSFEKWGNTIGDDTHGLLVTHIDYDSLAWVRNEININDKHPRVLYVPADGKYAYYDFSGVTFPGATNETKLITDSTNYLAKLFNPNTNGEYYLDKHIQNIRESEDGVISFVACADVPSIPSNISLSKNADLSLDCQWQPVESAKEYDIEFTSASRSCKAIQTFMDNSLEEGTMYYSWENYSDFFSIPGFGGTNIFASSRGVRLGCDSIGEGGRIYTFRTLPERTHSFTTVLRAEPYKEQTTVPIFVYKNLDDLSDTLTANVTHDDFYIFHFDEWYDDDRIIVKCMGSDELIVKEWYLFDGDFTVEDMQLPESAGMPMPDYSFGSDTITTDKPSYVISDYAQDTKYMMRVRARMPDGRESDWSGFVTLQNTTDISSMPAETTVKKDNAIYDLTGRRVTSPSTPGIYIRNGKKFIVGKRL